METLSLSGGADDDPHNAITVSDVHQQDESELQTLIRDLKRHFKNSPGVRSEYRLSTHDFDQFDKYVERKGWGGIRYDYYFDTQTLVLRMPSIKHEYVSEQIVDLLHTKIKQLCPQYRVKCPFRKLGSVDVRDHRNALQPDNSIYHVNTRGPVLVLEVGVSDSAKSLKEKAKAWIRTGRGNIRYVFTLKLDEDSQAVYLTTWTPEFVHEGQSIVLKAKRTYQTIRDVTGEPGMGAGLAISLDKITPGSGPPESLRHQTITISAEEVCEIVKEAEDFEERNPDETFELLEGAPVTRVRLRKVAQGDLPSPT